MKVFVVVLLSLPLAAQTSLTVKTATSKRVDLAWTGTASSYTVQRAVLGSSFATIGTATTTSYSDTTIDPYTTYRYQVVAGSTSNPVTAGPPPAGFSVAAAAPGSAASGIVANYGYDLSMALDGNGDPAFAFIFFDPNQDTDASDSQLLFRSWNRAQYKWNDVVKVAVVGDAATTFSQTVSLAFDSSTGMWALASEKNQSESIVLYTSPDGVAWTLKQNFNSGQSSTAGPSLALKNGNIYFAYVIGNQGLRYVTGVLSAAPSSWQAKFAPKPAGSDPAQYDVWPSLALDSAGVPAIAYWAADTTQGYNEILFFWRPSGTANPVKVTDTQNNQDDYFVKLLFFGTQPRIFFHAQRNDADFGVGDHFVRSDDGGATWKTPVVIPPDGTSSTDFPFDGAVDSKGDVTLAFGSNSGSGDSVCGNPKLSRSANLVNFTTCAAADVSITGNFDVFPGSIALAYGGNDKLYLMWWQQGDTSTGTGLLLWREPPAGTGSAPVINTDGTGVMNGATNLTGSPIVAGSWVTIKGANFSDAATNWNNLDFTSGLPTTINGVQVLLNGKAAATYYIQADQINVQAPSTVPTSGTVSVQVVRNNVASNTVTSPAAATAPGLFPYTIDGKTFYPAAVFLDGVLVGDPAVIASTRKAKAGDVVLLFATGMGVSAAGVLVNPTGFSPQVKVLIDSVAATVSSTFLVAPGEWQINIVIPSGLSDGNHQIVVQTGGVSSQSGVVIPITH
jgi:uncharacterized protein (TIGR03437 family)